MKEGILIVEDNMEVSRMFERAFRLHGHEVMLAYDGEAALKLLQSQAALPAAILLDIMMPHMNGLEFLVEMRKDERLKNVPVVVLTNSFHKEDAEHFLSSGANLYLVKIEHQSKYIVEKVEELIASGGNKN